MNLRIESTEKEIKKFLVEQIRLEGKAFTNISKFYPNRVGSSELLNGFVDTSNPVGRVYVEIN